MTARHMRRYFTIVACVLSVFAALAPAQEKDRPSDPLKKPLYTSKGPGTLLFQNIAKVNLPEGCLYLDGADPRVLVKRLQDPLIGGDLGSVIGENCTAVFQFDPIGYVNDNEKDRLDPAFLMNIIKKESAKGIQPIHIKGWHKKPCYDETTHTLEWIIAGKRDGEEILNVNTCILGRQGVMRITLITTQATITQDLPIYREWLKGFSYMPGQQYEAYRSGDKVAKYGLRDIVAGNGVIAMAKSHISESL